METDRVVDWLELGKDMVELIITRLRFLVDFISFGAVCKTWHSIFLENRHRLPHLHPVLIIPSYEKKEFQDLFRLSEEEEHFCLSEKHTYRLKKLSNEEENGKWWCFGTSEGCLIMIDFRLNISLLNPLTKTETPLPPLTSLSDIFIIRETGTGSILYTCHLPLGGTISDGRTFIPRMYVHKAVTDGPYVVAILGYQCRLAFCRRDSDSWTQVGSDSLQFEDLICYNGNFYAVDESGHVVIVDVSGPHPTMTKVAMVIGGGNYIGICRNYLVESSGELLMVVRRDIDMFSPYRTHSFDILRVDVNKHQCFPLEALGDCILFLAENCSMSLFARDFPMCERNCIYYVNENELTNTILHESYLRVYNVEDGSIKPYYKKDWNWNWLSSWPIWLTPKPW